MTTIEARDVRPKLRPGIVLGPAQRRGEAVVHHVKDPLTGWYYRIGAREHFLLSRMDGERTLDEIAGEYADTFGRRLGPENWQQLFAMLHRRQLLAGATDDESLARLTASAAAGAAKAKRGLLQARFPLLDPDRLFTRLAPRLAPLYSRWFVVPALLAVVALGAYVAYDRRPLTDAVADSRHVPVSVVLAFLVTWLIIVVHECAHGLTCKHFGGSAHEIGLLWRFPMLAPYCKVDDVVLLPPRHRVATAFAGVFATMLALLPFAAIWAVAPDGGPLHGFAGSILLFGGVTAGINLVPFLRLDGYYMLTHALNLVDLRAETYRFYGRLLRGGPAAVRGYQRRDTVAYAGYGAATAAFAIGVGVLLGRLWFDTMRGWVGPAWAAAILVAEGVLLALFVAYGVRHAQRAKAAAPTSPA